MPPPLRHCGRAALHASWNGPNNKEKVMKASARRWVVAVGVVALGSAAATGAWAGAGAVGVSDVKAEVKARTLGADKGKNWVKVTFTATVKEKVEKLNTVKVKISCKVGPDTLTDDTPSLTAKLSELDVGKTAAMDARLFFDKGEGFTAAKPDSCTVSFGFGKSTKKDEFTAIGDYCFDGTAVADGACK
jgi:hypothetical protein